MDESEIALDLLNNAKKRCCVRFSKGEGRLAHGHLSAPSGQRVRSRTVAMIEMRLCGTDQ